MTPLGVVLLPLLFANTSNAFDPYSADSRIKTYIFSENEVYILHTKLGYQSHIEFGPNEKVRTISVGNTGLFKITPAGNRIFIKPLLPNSHTNMTVITSNRAYQFDVSSEAVSDREVSYVMRFYFPESDIERMKKQGNYNAGQSAASYAPPAEARPMPLYVPTPQPVMQQMRPMQLPPIIQPQMQMPPQISMQKPAMFNQAMRPAIPAQSMQPQMPPYQLSPRSGKDSGATIAPRKKNYNYTLSGGDSIAPVQVFDNGRATYFKFPDSAKNINIIAENPQGQQVRLSLSKEDEYLYVPVVAQKFIIKDAKDTVIVYNES